MSDQFPMPKSLTNEPVPGFERPTNPPPVSSYAPRPAPQRGLEAVAQAMAPSTDAGRSALSQAPRQPLGQHTQAIRESIKLLTHREMREMVAAIFEAQKKLGGAATDETITRTELADVLDRFAYGE